MRLGLLGGTFDPIHNAHLILAEKSFSQLSLDKLFFIPSFIPPHKHGRDISDPGQRAEMVRLAIEGDARFDISDYEISKGQVSYTIDTVRYFRETFGEGAEIFFIVGSDWVGDLKTWKDIDKITELCTLVFAARRGYDGMKINGIDMVEVKMPPMDISSTMIRENIKNAKPVNNFLPQKVLKYILVNSLYKG